jgi:tripartite-type tricarboxylate transporter receptor subunit TctC
VNAERIDHRAGHARHRSGARGVPYVPVRACSQTAPRATHRYAQAIFAALLVLTSAIAAAADVPYPTRPVRLVLGFPPGGTSDFLARVIGEHLAANLGQPVVIDNRPGAAGNIAAELVAKAPPDGYTLFLSSGSTAVAPSLYKKLNYDVLRDFAQVTQLVDVPFILAASPQLPARTVSELITYIRAHPREINYASSGVGTPSHLASEMLRQLAGLEVTHVPYKGTVAAMVDLISGRVQFYFTSFPGALGHVRAGRVRAIAVSSLKRSPALPDVPSLDESGIKGYRAGSWYGLALPRGVSPAIISRIHGVVQQGLASADMKAKLSGEGLDVTEGLSPEQATAFVRQDVARWAEVIRRAGVTPN